MTKPSNDNRAASAMFQAFGGVEPLVRAEARSETSFRGMHRGERLFLSLWIPLALLVAAGDATLRCFGLTAGLALAVPAAWILLHVLPFLLQARTPVGQWRLWLAAGVLWAWFHRDSAGINGWFAWAWAGLFAVESAGLLWLCFLRTMAWNGRSGIVWRLILLATAHAAAIAAGPWLGWMWTVAMGAGIAAFYCLAVLRPGCQWLGPVVRRTQDAAIQVTIDDGPDAKDTPVMLDLLDHYGVKAVFFMIGEKVVAHPELAREVIRRGHEIGNHTMSHPQASFWCAGPWRTRREISECQRVIEEITGARPRWFRAPVGHRNFFTHPVAADLGLGVMGWTRRGYDAVGTDAGKVLTRILSGVGPGDILLVHEATPIAAQVLEGVLKNLAKQESLVASMPMHRL